MDAAGFFFGADNTTCEVTFGSNFCTPPQNRVFQNRFRSNSTISPDDCAATQLRAWIDNCRFVNRQSPVGIVHRISRKIQCAAREQRFRSPAVAALARRRANRRGALEIALP
jgi:hypothetical protein